jgi:hypothetical protein
VLVLILGTVRSAGPGEANAGLLAALRSPPKSAESEVPIIFHEAPGPERRNDRRSDFSDRNRVAGGGDRAKPKSDKPCIPAGTEYVTYHDTGLTGLALLAFLGQGISVGSKIEIVDTAMGKRHLAGDVVKKGIKWLVDKQDREQGWLSDPDAPYNMYSEALSTMALCEAYGISQSRAEASRAERGELAGGLAEAQPGRARWGWRYSKKRLEDQFARTGSTRVTVQRGAPAGSTSRSRPGRDGPEVRRARQPEVPSDVMPGALEYARYVTGKEGLVGYQSPTGGR